MARRRRNNFLKPWMDRLKKKDNTKNNIKRLLNKETTNVRELVDKRNNIQDQIKEYLEEKQYTVYLSKIRLPLSITIIVSPPILKPDLTQLKYDFNLTDYDLEVETTEHTGQYYFR